MHGDSRSLGDESDQLFQDVVEKDMRPTFPPTTAVPAVRDIAIDCWARNAARRPTFAEVDNALQNAFQARFFPGGARSQSRGFNHLSQLGQHKTVHVA